MVDAPNSTATPRAHNYLIITTLIVAAYLLLSAATMLIPTPVYPIGTLWFPAGLAWAALAIFGIRYWPAIAIAVAITAYLLTLGVDLSNLQIIFTMVVTAGSAVLEAILCLVITRQFEGRKSIRLDNSRSVRGFGLAVLISCFISAFISVGALYSVGIINRYDLFYAGMLWFIGNCIGLVLMGCLCLTFAPGQSPLWRSRRFGLGGTILATTVALVVILNLFWSSQRLQAQNWLDDRGEKILLTLEQGIETNLLAVFGVEGLFAASNFVDGDEFRQFTKGYLNRLPAINALGWASYVDGPGVTSLERAIGNGYRVRDYIRNVPVVTTQTSLHFPEVYAEPAAALASVRGADLLTHPVRRKAIMAAIDTRQPTATEPTKMINDPEGPLSVLVFHPIFDTPFYPQINPPKQEAGMPSGIAVAAVNVTGMLSTLLPELNDDLRLTISDPAADTNRQELFVQGPAALTADQINHSQLPRWQQQVSLADRRWNIALQAQPSLSAKLRSWTDVALLLGALILTFLVIGVRLILTGHTERIEALVTDRTSELTEANQQLSEAYEQRSKANKLLQRQTDELRRSNQELQQFAYISSHDLQEPLRSISGFTTLLKKRYGGTLDKSGNEYIEFISTGAERMRQIIVDLLTYSRVGSQQLQPEPAELKELLRAAEANLSDKIRENSASISFDRLPAVHADKGQITVLLQNLIGNSIKYRDPENAPEIHVSATRQDTAWCIAVADNGIGIKPEHHKQIFEIFKRLHSNVYYQGTGIGLAICKRVVERHGGKMWLDSEENQGCTFYFTLPDELPEDATILS